MLYAVISFYIKYKINYFPIKCLMRNDIIYYLDSILSVLFPPSNSGDISQVTESKKYEHENKKSFTV